MSAIINVKVSVILIVIVIAIVSIIKSAKVRAIMTSECK